MSRYFRITGRCAVCGEEIARMLSTWIHCDLTMKEHIARPDVPVSREPFDVERWLATEPTAS